MTGGPPCGGKGGGGGLRRAGAVRDGRAALVDTRAPVQACAELLATDR